MISFLICLFALVAGYFLYGKFIEKVFRPDPSRVTPAISKADGVDFVAMPTWKVFMIQFLNIAGTGPIFGAIMGAQFGPASFLWIVFGCIFGGAMHDYLSGMLSVRHGGMNLPGIIGTYLGNGTKKVMLCFTVLLLLLVGAVFVYSPASILGQITAGAGNPADPMISFGDSFSISHVMFWVIIIFIYYFLATMVPIDKLIGRIYPIFAVSLIFMAVSLCIHMFIKWPAIPELWDGLGNRSPQTLGSMFPCMFISIACGAISGFHATQSPMMARCMKNEKLGRPIFYGSMITEGVVALIWAAAASYYFFAGGADELGAPTTAAPKIVALISKGWLGVLGGILAMLGVVAAPITSGDTALRSSRLIVAEALKLKQTTLADRFKVAIPVFAVALFLLVFSIQDDAGFQMLWRYFGWANQTLSVFTLWAVTVFLYKYRKGLNYIISLVPACFMTAVCATYICTAKIGFNIPVAATPWLGIAFGIIPLIIFIALSKKMARNYNNPEI